MPALNDRVLSARCEPIGLSELPPVRWVGSKTQTVKCAAILCGGSLHSPRLYRRHPPWHGTAKDRDLVGQSLAELRGRKAQSRLRVTCAIACERKQFPQTAAAQGRSAPRSRS